MTRYVIKPDLTLLHTLAGLATYHKKAYCYPSQDKLVELHRRHQKRRMSRRTLNRHAAALEASGWLTRLRRHRATPRRGWEFRSTLYMLTPRAYRWFSTLARALSQLGLSRVTKTAHYEPPQVKSSAPLPSKEGQGPPCAVDPARWASEMRAVLNPKG